MDILVKDLIPLAPLSEYKVHFAVWNRYEHPLDVFVRSRDEWKEWNQYRGEGSKDVFNEKFIFSLIRDHNRSNTWIFGGIFEVLSRGFNQLYQVELSTIAQEYVGRLVVTHPGPGVKGRSFLATRYFPELRLCQILEKPYQGQVFPGYENVNIPFSQLESIVLQEKQDWKVALQNCKGVYLITDASNGQMYVGSAYGLEGIWSRWSCYIGTGHGWGEGLTRLIKANGLAYAREHFQLSLLEYMPMKAEDAHVIEREQHWKEVLKTRQFGYNRN